MADRDPIQPLHEPAEPVFEEEAAWVHHAAERFEDASAEELLEWAIETFHPKLAISAAGGVDGMVLIDMAAKISPDIRVFTLDTGRLPPETYQLFEDIRDRYGIQVEFEQPDGDAVSKLVTEHGPNLMYKALDLRLACCNIRKVEPLKRKLATLDAWIAGLRREQWKSRRNIAKVELDREHGGIVKLNPLADWTLERVWAHVREYDVPYHELFDHGYTSIGCAPCTRAVLPGESERAGRWWWEQDTDKECGIHCSVGLLGSKSDSERSTDGSAAATLPSVDTAEIATPLGDGLRDGAREGDLAEEVEA
jgi:thioredoxin-dependent adenylylsulfate APS reductase